MTKPILVTGGAGFIGTHLIKRLLDDFQDATITVVDDFSSGLDTEVLRHERVNFIHGSIADNQVLKVAFAEKPIWVFHLAALFANQNSVDHPMQDLKTSGLGTLALLEHANENGVEAFVYASSSCVYKSGTYEYTEDSPLQPTTPYGITKLLGEHYAEFFNKHYKLPVSILRYFNVYGPGDYPGAYRSVIPNFFKKAFAGEPLNITGNGSETRDFTYVDDIVTGTISSVGHPGIFNLGTGREVTILRLAEIINTITENQAGIKLTPQRTWDNTTHRVANITKANSTFNYSTTTSIESGLKATADWFETWAIT